MRAKIAGMTKSEAIAKAKTARELARILGVTPSAVSQWPDGELPELHNYRLKDRKPHWFRRKRQDRVEQPAKAA